MNGDCPVGAKNGADIRNLTRTCDELRGSIRELSGKIDTLTEGQTKMRIADAWDFKRLVLAMILLVIGSSGGGLLADVLRAAMGGP